MRNYSWSIVFVLSWLSAAYVAAQDQETVPKELTEYIDSARKSGMLDAKIRQDALAAGWPPAVIDKTLTRTAESAPTRPSEVQPPVQENLASVTSATPSPVSGAPGAGSSPKQRGVPRNYRIGAGDVLQISVWKEPDVSVPNVVVRPDGMIAMPLVKEIQVVDLTPAEVEQKVAEKLENFIHDVDVTVIVTKIESKKIYLSGGVKKEGPIPYTYRMTVMQALSEAGGLTDYAKRRKVYILRNDGEKESRFPFNYQEVIRGEKMEQNIVLIPGDLVVVPQ